MAKVLVQGLATGGKPASDPDKDRREKELKLREEEVEFKKLKEKRLIEKGSCRRKTQSGKVHWEEKGKEEIDLRRMEVDRQRGLDAAIANDDSSLVGRTRKFAEAIKNIFPDMSTESAELSAFLTVLKISLKYTKFQLICTASYCYLERRVKQRLLSINLPLKILMITIW